ncbi:MAG: F0F1 ATP synthase subunit delta [Verrucomicrobiota bacterium]|jgi:F-type H+-transporting ATPase subunit delta
MKLAKDSRKLTKQLFRSSLTEGRLDEGKVKIIVKAVIDQKPRMYLGILKEYYRLVRMEVSKRHAIIESAVELDAKTRSSLVKDQQSRYGAEMTSEFKVVPELLAGIRMKIGSDVFDNSVRERLARLHTQLTQA